MAVLITCCEVAEVLLLLLPLLLAVVTRAAAAAAPGLADTAAEISCTVSACVVVVRGAVRTACVSAATVCVRMRKETQIKTSHYLITVPAYKTF